MLSTSTRWNLFPLPQKLNNKKAIINIKDIDEECLKWALRAALFPAPQGKTPARPSSYPINDGINYKGIDFPMPLSQINKLEKQNSNILAGKEVVFI